MAGSRVLILGVAYKRDIDDIRESPGAELLRVLLQRDVIVRFHDPLVPTITLDNDYPSDVCRSVELTVKCLQSQDAVIVVTDHSAYDWSFVRNNCRLLLSTRRLPVDEYVVI